MPGPESYHSPEDGHHHRRDGAVSAINSRSRRSELEAYELEPQMLTSLFDAEQRSKRQLVKYDDIPKIDGGSGHVNRRPPVFSAQRRQFHAPGGSRLDRRYPSAPPAGRFDHYHAAFAGVFSEP